MKKLSKDAENKLMAAIEKTATIINDGMSPSSAIAKAAAEDRIPPGHIRLMVHAYNTGRTSRQRSEGESALEKAADFPLADASEVLEQLYPSQVKTAAAIQSSTIISTEYAIPPTGMLSRRAKQEKAANNIDWRTWSRGEYADDDGNVHQREVTASAPEPYGHDPAEAYKRAYAETERQTRAFEELRRKKAAAMDKMASTFNEMSNYFRRTDATPIPIVKEQAYLLHGGKGRQLIDQIVQVTPGLAKMAQHTRAVISNSLQPVDGEVYGLISQFLDELDQYKQASHNFNDAASKIAQAKEDTLRPFQQGLLSVLDDEIFSPTSEKQATVPGMLYGASAVKNLLGGVADSAKDPSAGPFNNSQSVYESLTDPDHEADLRNIRSQAMLQDLMLNDDVIGGYDPQQTINAYNDIVSMSPRAGSQRLLMQSLLRKNLEQGAMDTFEADQLLGIEEKQRKLTSPPGKGIGDESVLG